MLSRRPAKRRVPNSRRVPAGQAEEVAGLRTEIRARSEDAVRKWACDCSDTGRFGILAAANCDAHCLFALRVALQVNES